MQKKPGFMALLTVAMVLMLTTCNNGLTSSSGGMGSSGATERGNRSRRTIIDSGKYIDLTAAENDAKKYRKQDVLMESRGTFHIEGGNSYITVDRGEGTIVLSSDDAFYQGTKGHNIYAKFTFDVGAASKDCIYIRMGDRKRAQLIIDNQTFVNDQVPDLVVCVPLYGFGRNRLEVSSVMNGFIAMPSGTYWLKN